MGRATCTVYSRSAQTSHKWIECTNAKEAIEVIEVTEVITSVEVIETAEFFRTTQGFEINKLMAKISLFCCFEKKNVFK